MGFAYDITASFMTFMILCCQVYVAPHFFVQTVGLVLLLYRGTGSVDRHFVAIGTCTTAVREVLCSVSTGECLLDRLQRSRTSKAWRYILRRMRRNNDEMVDEWMRSTLSISARLMLRSYSSENTELGAHLARTTKRT